MKIYKGLLIAEDNKYTKEDIRAYKAWILMVKKLIK